MKTELPLPKPKKKTVVLSRMTCGQLADVLSVAADPNVPESPRLQWLRQKLGGAHGLRMLRAIAKEPALHWRSKMHAAEVILSAPQITLTCTGGTPNPATTLRSTKVSRRIAQAHGVKLENINGKACIITPSKTEN